MTREDLDKAIGHGLSHAPVKAIMSSDAVTCDEDTPLAELQRLVASSRDGGRVPVLRDGEVVGVVTRERRPARRSASPRPSPERASLTTSATGCSPSLALGTAFEAIQAVSEPFDGVYLVGGTVRDIVLGEEGFDLDIAVEGDGIALGRALAAALGGRVVPHEKFGTAVVQWPGGRIDVATARTEFYDEPGALPTVEQATIRQDLFRRDFTINAMAVSLKGEDFGRLVDPFGGLRRSRESRRSASCTTFRSSTTRRGSSARSGTRTATASGWTGTPPGSRAPASRWASSASSRPRGCATSSSLLLGEERVSDSIRRLGELGLAPFVHPHLAVDEETVASSSGSTSSGAGTRRQSRPWRLRLAALARRLSADELFDWFGRLKLRRRDADRIADAVAVAPRLSELLARVEGADEARRLIEPHDPDGALLALALTPPAIRRRVAAALLRVAALVSSSRSRAPTSPLSGWASLRGSERYSTSYCDASSTASFPAGVSRSSSSRAPAATTLAIAQ